MPMEPKNKSLIPSQSGGLIQDGIRYTKLIWRLISDKRINIFLKILPVASLVYLISPIDMLPGMALPFIGALDDAAILWIGTSLFISLCPEEIVNEHTLSLEKNISGNWKNFNKEDEIVDVEARDITEDQPQ